MSLKLEELLGMFDTLSSIKPLKEEKTPLKKTAGKTITLPKIQISEDWGKLGTPDRGVLQSIVFRATRGSAREEPNYKTSFS